MVNPSLNQVNSADLIKKFIAPHHRFPPERLLFDQRIQGHSNRVQTSKFNGRSPHQNFYYRKAPYASTL